MAHCDEDRRSTGWLWIVIGIALPLLALWLRGTESGRLTVIHLDCTLRDAPQARLPGDGPGELRCEPPGDDKTSPVGDDEATSSPPAPDAARRGEEIET